MNVGLAQSTVERMLALSDQEEMQQGWNARAARDPFFYVETSHWNGDIDRFFERGEETACLLIDQVQKQYKVDTKNALDLGCGLGRFSRALAKRFSRVIAVDVSDQMIANAKGLHPWPEFRNIDFQANDGATLPIESNSIDFVWSYEVLQHAPSEDVLQSNINEVGRVLRPAGLAMVHLKTGYQRPMLQAVLRVLPQWLISVIARVASQDPMMADRTFRGPPPITSGQIEVMFKKGHLKLLKTINDPTHPYGTRVFALASK
jgi:SAM-dependent methyltransferase